MEILTHLRKTNARHSSLADKTVQKEKETKIESGASYNTNRSARGTQHSRAAHCLSQTTAQPSARVFTSKCLSPCSCSQPEHLDKEEHTVPGSPNTSFQHTAARQSCPTRLRGKAFQPVSCRAVRLPLLLQADCEKPG